MKIAKQSVELIDSMGTDLSVCNAARVSFAKESEWEQIPPMERFEKPRHKLSDKDAKLISYLAKHGHWSPFAHNSISLRIKAPIFVARQLVKHQVGLTWNEVSRRYVEDEPSFYFPETLRGRPEGSVKQGSGATHPKSDVYLTGLRNVTHDSNSYYLWLVKQGVAPEQARMVLPQNTMTEWIWTGSLMAFVRVCKQRLDPHAQQETREVAQMIKEIIEPLFPISWKALME